MGFWVFAVNTLDDFGQGIDIGLGGDVVLFVLVIGANVDNDYVGSRVLLEVPRLWVIWVSR
jgi:hypothetical protein